MSAGISEEKRTDPDSQPDGNVTVIPEYGWQVSLDYEFPEKRGPIRMLRLQQIMKLTPMFVRMFMTYMKLKRQGKRPPIDAMNPLEWKPVYGVPVGGIGCGCINRGWKGDFCRWSLTPGMYTYDIVPANQDTSLPVGVFVWEIHNKNDEPIDVTIMMTWQNGTGERTDKSGDRWNEPFTHDGKTQKDFQVHGVLLHAAHPTMKCTMAISAACKNGVKISHKTHFDPYGDGMELWEDLVKDGELDSPEGASRKTREGKATSAAVAAKCHVNGGGKTDNIEFCLAWDMPNIHFGGKSKSYSRRYTCWFGKDGSAAPSLSSYALNEYQEWERKITEWQDPILKCKSLPSWYKSALFNELYYISDGGTVWIEANDETIGIMKSKEPMPSVVKEYGRFAYLEGHEYRLYNTYDVHFYASFALVMLWPNIQLSLQYDIASTIPEEDTETRTESANGKTSIRKTANCVPHDIGDPEDEPWLKVNAYHFHDTSDWKDLNLKFVLQVYRDYFCLKDMEYLQRMWPQVQAVMKTALSWDTDGDGIVDNSGYADQTYDIWVMTGASAYCGGLWLAALRMTIEMAKLLNHDEKFQEYSEILAKAKASYEKKLWNGKYYNYDSSGKSYSDSIMSDQAVGQWFLKACDLVSDNDEVFPKEHVQSALKTIYDVNVMGFEQGTMGAVNGMRPDGKVDTTSFQAEEVWTGVTYAVAASMIQEGMLDEAFKTASGVYETCYQRTGLGFQTPEGYFAKSCYRSLGYMRPLAIWAMQYALEKFGHLK
ncbi:non-lysosomal glucosylceramidase-like isoform X2 [Ptychodera flava]|uniref:non-lysosomal glucosylceramidase-like isoform X2 n=1 Tax=Ptychodera flava TaxID=63121 RepID=UPI00396A39C0